MTGDPADYAPSQPKCRLGDHGVEQPYVETRRGTAEIAPVGLPSLRDPILQGRFFQRAEINPPVTSGEVGKTETPLQGRVRR